MSSLEAALVQGRDADRQEDYAGAISAFGNASQLEGGQYIGNCHLGWTHLTYGKANLAIESFRAALRCEPTSLMANLGIAHAFYESNDWDRSAKHYNTAMFLFSEPLSEAASESSQGHADTANTWTQYSVIHAGAIVPLPYLAYSVFSKLNNIANIRWNIGILDVPELYVEQVSQNPKAKSEQFRQKLKDFRISFAPLTNNYCDALMHVTYSNIGDLGNVLGYFIEGDASHVLVHERVCHAFDFLFNGIGYASPAIASSEEHSIFTVASRACSEGFAYWIQQEGIAFHNLRAPSRQLPDPTGAIFDDYSPSHPYKIGLTAFETIERKHGTEHAILAYLIAFDVPEIVRAGAFESGALDFFKMPRNNPNRRLLALADLEIQSSGMSALRFARQAQIELDKKLAALERCRLSGAIQ